MSGEKMSDGRRLRLARGLHDRIPSGFPCKSGCFSCCKTRVQVLRVEWEALKKLPVFASIEAAEGPDYTVYELTSKDPGEQEIVMIVDSRGWCPFVNGETGACRVYNDRPLTCRLYAQSIMLPCEEGVACPPELEVEQDVLDKHLKLAGMDRPNDQRRAPEEVRAFAQALNEWRTKNGSRQALPDARADREKIHQRAEEILGRKFA